MNIFYLKGENGEDSVIKYPNNSKSIISISSANENSVKTEGSP